MVIKDKSPNFSNETVVSEKEFVLQQHLLVNKLTAAAEAGERTEMTIDALVILGCVRAAFREGHADLQAIFSAKQVSGELMNKLLCHGFALMTSSGAGANVAYDWVTGYNNTSLAVQRIKRGVAHNKWIIWRIIQNGPESFSYTKEGTFGIQRSNFMTFEAEQGLRNLPDTTLVIGGKKLTVSAYDKAASDWLVVDRKADVNNNTVSIADLRRNCESYAVEKGLRESTGTRVSNQTVSKEQALATLENYVLKTDLASAKPETSQPMLQLMFQLLIQFKAYDSDKGFAYDRLDELAETFEAMGFSADNEKDLAA